MNKIVLKTFGAVTAVAMFAAVAVPSANALTSADVELLISLLGLSGDQASAVRALATDSSSTTGSSAFCGPFSRSLTVGSTGADVTQLQTALESTGDLVIPVGVSKGYFGALTKSALASYQAKNGIAPAVGYFGPVTQSSFATKCSTVPTTPTNNSNNSSSNSSSDLEGGAGSVDTYDLISSLNNEEVGEDEEDVEVAGVEIEVSDSSDIEITAVKLDFAQGTATNDDFEDFADEISIWLDGEEVGRASAGKFDEDNGYASTITLDKGAIIRSNDTADLVVAVSGARSLDSDDEGKTWTVDFASIRFKDAQGVTISEDPLTAVRTFSFEAFASAADAELKITTDGKDEINDAHVIDIDDNDDTDNVPLLRFEVEVEGKSDLTIDDFPVFFTVTGATDVDALISTAYLYVDGEEVGSENVSSSATTATTTFDDLDLELEAGETYEFVIKADFNPTADAGVTDGDTIKAEVRAGERAAIDVEDESGEDLVAGDRTGTALGDAHEIRDKGINVKFVGSSYTKTTSDTSGVDESVEFVLEFEVTAFGGDIYVDKTCGYGDTAIATSTVFSVDNDTDDSSTCSDFDSTGDEGTNGFLVNEDQTETFELTVLATANEGSAGTGTAYKVQINGIGYALTDANGTTIYNFDLADYDSKSVTVFNR